MKIMLDPGAKAPIRATAGAAGLDLFSPVDVQIRAHGIGFIDTGVHVQLAADEYGEIKGRSGLTRRGLMVPTGTIDSDYTGGLGVTLYNFSGDDYHVHAGDRIAQLVVSPVRLPDVEIVEALDGTERGENGFGSTGR